VHVNVAEEGVAARDSAETGSLLTGPPTRASVGVMSSETAGGGFPGGFPSMPGFGDSAAANTDVLDRLAELTERHRSGALSDADYADEKDRLLSGG